MRHISNGEYMHFFRSLRTVVPRLRRVHASYLKWRPIIVAYSFVSCAIRTRKIWRSIYNLRSDRPRINYKALLEPKLPKLTASTGGRASRKIDTHLYPVEVVETEGTRMKIHYVGYADKHDEWREAEEVESVCEESEEAERYTPFARRQGLGSKQAQERSGSSSTKKYWLTRRH